MRKRRLAALALLCLIPAGNPAQAPSPADIATATAAAQAGLLDAETKLKAWFPVHTFDAPPQPWRYWGADATEATPPLPTDPVQGAVNPSFAIEVDGDPANNDPTPRALKIGGATRGYSGVHAPGTYATNGNPFSLKVSDLSGRLYVNDGLIDGPAGSVSQNLKRILNVLGQQLGEALLGDRILAGRPAGGYASLDALLPALGSQASLDRVRNFLTAHAWVDRNVANPVPLSQVTVNRYPVQYYRGPAGNRVYRFASSIDSNGNEIISAGMADTIPNGGAPHIAQAEAQTIYGLDQLNPQWIEIVGRAPVNVNAAPREVLIALLANLQGFFVAERKRNNPNWEGELLTSIRLESTFSQGTFGRFDVYGYLTETYPIVAPGGGPGISAFDIANEILACRERRASARFNYATVPWGGPFRSWHQFNLFVDNLIPIGLLDDPRSVHAAYDENGADFTGYAGLLTQDPEAKRHAVRAIADVIKANFNPNLHLNELNPDENLHLRVDKTDLFVNSTEFCFVPAGYFEVESVGKVVRPTDAQADALLASNNELMAQVKTVAVLKLYDQYRETSQKQFYAGTIVARSTQTDTSNDGTLEIGPEPDNGVFPGNLGAPGLPDNEWDGYIALPTVGGPWHNGNPVKAKNTLATTVGYAKNPHFLSSMHAHYGLDVDACDHVGTRLEIAGRLLADDPVQNYPSKVGGGSLLYGRPNDPTKGNHRLARSFRIDGGAPPALPSQAPTDLRVDGTYAERHSAPAYYAHETSGLHLWDFNTQNARGMFSLWIKPSFNPDLTGKIRKFWDMSRHHGDCGSQVNVWPFGLVFQPVQYFYDLSDIEQPMAWHAQMGRFQSRSMYFGSIQWHNDDQFTTGAGHQFGKITRSLNHLGHSDEGSPSPLQAHRWINVTCSWALNGAPDNTGNLAQLLINGSTQFTPFSHTSMTGGWADGTNRMNGFNRHSGGEFNQMRLGGTSLIGMVPRTFAANNLAYRGNHSSDATIDEFYVWPTEATQSPDLLWIRGRYFNLRGQTGAEGRFTSQAFGLAPAPGPVKILGASWTWYGDGADPNTFDRTLQDHGLLYTGVPARDLQPKVLVSVIDGALTFGPYADDGFSPVLSLAGTAPTIADPAQVRYSVHFQHTTSGAIPVLTTTPVFDDVTLYWTNGAPSGVVTTSPPAVVTDPPPYTGGGGGGGGGGGCGLLGLELLLLALLRKMSRTKCAATEAC